MLDQIELAHRRLLHLDRIIEQMQLFDNLLRVVVHLLELFFYRIVVGLRGGQRCYCHFITALLNSGADLLVRLLLTRRRLTLVILVETLLAYIYTTVRALLELVHAQHCRIRARRVVYVAVEQHARGQRRRMVTRAAARRVIDATIAQLTCQRGGRRAECVGKGRCNGTTVV